LRKNAEAVLNVMKSSLYRHPIAKALTAPAGYLFDAANYIANGWLR